MADKTVTICIGNSDDKLTQKKWARFCNNIDSQIKWFTNKVHFAGFSRPDSIYQNACWVITIESDEDLQELKEQLTETRKKFLQNSVAVVVGDTEFI